MTKVNEATLLIGVEGAQRPREDGTGETPQAASRGGSRTARRQAKRLERRSTDSHTFLLEKVQGDEALHLIIVLE
ncbi:hypothetical protein LG311_05510 [Sutcliffiella horikoshii]|uniref:hypothetical protein n=1 Tax=Sutcliffiella horikoshii TaxID=79883 RepID=UPI00384E4A15